MTGVGAALVVLLVVCETSAFLTAQSHTRLVIDSNEDALLRINFDVTMLDMSCDNVVVGIWDAFGTDKLNITRNVLKQRVDHKGARKGKPYTEEEIAELEFSNMSFTSEELAELDSDWGSSSDHFKHDDFQAVVNAHAFTMVNFYADWCPHCKQFAPTWAKFEEAVNSGHEQVKDADGEVANVRVLKINCVDFQDACREQKVRGFPSIRLYRRGQEGKNFQVHQGPRTQEGLNAWVRSVVSQAHTHVNAAYHDIFNEGCRLSGHLEASRVPGTLHFQAMHTREHSVNLALTNVSHVVHHFSFGESPRGTLKHLPKEYRRNVSPMDGVIYVTDKFHKAPHHFIKVVHTRFEGSNLRSYQQTHQWSTRTLQRNAIPQAKFSYDLSPVEVVVSKGDRRWYDYLTQLFAIVGGTFSVMSMTVGFLRAFSMQVKSMLNKMN